MIRLSRFTLALAVMASLATFLAPAAYSWPGSNGAIVFETFIDGGGEEHSRGRGIAIAPLGADRSQITHLTADPADSDPQVSPDGRQVVFVRSSDPEAFRDATPTTIYLINVDGSGLRPLTDGLHPDTEPAFSASGARVYFTRDTMLKGGEIFSIRLDGGGLSRIITEPQTTATRGWRPAAACSPSSAASQAAQRVATSTSSSLEPTAATSAI
jgi:dipeptidyl aminopeptidase/acylaminoacyl peptidase